MLTRTKILGLTIATLLVLTLVPGVSTGHPSLGYARDRQGRPTTAALPEPLNTLSNTEATEAHFSDFSVPSASSVVQATTADAENVEFVGHIGGGTYAVAVQGNYAYIGVGPRLTILDISNPASPTVVGKTDPLPGVVEGMVVSGGYAYIADRQGGLRVIGISTPSNPTEVGFYDTSGLAEGVAVSGGYAYIADRQSGLRVIDVSTPSNPTEVGFCGMPGEAWGVAVSGGYAYVADWDGLWVVDVSDPTNPTEVGFRGTPGEAWGVAVAGGYAYVADRQSGLRVIDVSTPSNPTEVGFYDTPVSAVGVAVSGGYAYVADRGDGLRVLDVSTPSNPTEVGFYDTPEEAWGVAVAGGYAYVADRYDGLRIVDVSTPSNNPTEVGFYDTSGLAEGVAGAGDYAYVADWDGGLRVVDVSDPANPTEVGFYDAPGWALGVAVSGGYAYVAAGGGGLRVVDVSTPSNPTEVGFYDTPGGALGVAVSGGYAYVADWDGGLRVVDVSDPANPTEAGFCDTPGWACGVAGAGGYAYVADRQGGLRVMDVSTPSNPMEVGFYDTPGSARGVAVAGGYAYVADEYDGLRVVDISDPSNPTEVGFHDTPGWAWGVAGAGGYAYVADGDGGLIILRYMGGEPGPTPVPQDPLILSASSTYATNEHVTARTSIYNSSPASKTFDVTVSLLKDGATEDSLTKTTTVAGYGTAALTFDFGTRPAGSYQIGAELWEGATLLKTKEHDVTVLASDDQARALRWVDLLTRSAEREFQEGANLVADTDADAMTRMGSGLLGKAFSLLIGWLGDLGRAAGLLSTDVDSAAATVSAKLTDLKKAWSMSVVKGLRVAVMEEINAYLAPQRQQVDSKHQEMSTFVEGHTFTWPNGLERTLASYDDAIQSRVESEEISAVLQPPRFIGKSTLTGYRASYDFYDLYGKIFSAIALAAAVGVILISVFVSGGLSLTAIVPALATLRHNASLIALGVTGLLGLISIGMDTSFEYTVAPAITAQHTQRQDGFRSALESARGVAFSDFTTNVGGIESRRVSLATQVRNADEEGARPLVETYIYSPDGRVIEILSAQPDLSPGERTMLQGDITLPPGPYRAVSAVHTREHIALSTQAVIFQVPGPEVQLTLSLVDPQLTFGEALNATVFITNTDPISGTGDLAVIAVSSDEENFQTWTVNLDPGASERLDCPFVPQAEGAYHLDISVSDGYGLLARQSAAYVVGTGASLSLNYSAQALYDPILDVTLPVTVTNAGMVSTSTMFSLVTLDRLNDLTQVHSQTTTLTVDAGTDASLDATALPSVQPGLYTTHLLLDGALHASLDFAVAAQDTLFANIYPDAVFHNVGDSVTLTVGIMDSAYNYTDATTDVTVWRPDGVTQAIAMSSIATGQYEGSVTAPITGTCIATVGISKPNCRVIGSSTYFVVGQRSSLWPTLEGGPILGQTAPLTITIRNEGGLAIEGATLTFSSTVESLVGNTDAAGLAVLWPTATVTDSYQLTVDKTGFAQTVTEVPVQVISDTVPPWLYLDAPGVTNHTPMTVTGLTEAGASLTINSQAVAVDAQGRFTTTVALSEGANTLNAAVTDAVSNTTTITRAITLDTVPPTLTVTCPPDGLITFLEVISVTGSTEAGASLTVSDTLVPVDPESGGLGAWVLLHPGVNCIPITAADAADNVTAITRTVERTTAVQADFTASPTFGLAPLTVVFTNTSTGDYDSCIWHFGDGITSTVESPTHTYTVPGIYTVTLTVSEPEGSDTAVKAGYINAIQRSCYVRLNDAPSEYDNVQDAVNAAHDGDIVKVAGYCSGVEMRAGVTQTVYISKSITLRGGYTTTNWTEPDPEANPTTLDAQGLGRVLYITGDISPTIEGLRITGGDATGLGGRLSDDVGGGVYVVNATLTLESSEIHDNQADWGGGVYLDESDNVALSGNAIHSNTADDGGGICLLHSADAVLSSNTIYSNTADRFGGGVALWSVVNATLGGNYIYNNTTHGGGGIVLGDNYYATLSGNTIYSNTAYYGGGVYLLRGAYATLSGNHIYNNTGGGVRLSCSDDATLSGNHIYNNTAYYGSGVYLLRSSDVNLNNNFITDNEVSWIGRGSAMFLLESTADLRHNTIARNTGGDGSGVNVTLTSTVAMTNTILVSHTVGITVAVGNTATMKGTLWYGNGQDIAGAGTIVTGTDNCWGDPAFVDPAIGDYHIGPGSAAVDAGVLSGVMTDIDGEPRPMRSGYDIGADEQPPLPTAFFDSSSPDWLGQTTIFTNATTTVPPDDSTVTYFWSFGDGVTSTQENPTRLYASAGLYTVTLTSTNVAGSDIATNTVTIYSRPSVTFTTSTPDWLGQATHFTATVTTIPPDDPSVSPTWDFGDGTVQPGPEAVSHTYAAPGTHTVILTATNPAGANAATDTVIIYSPPTAAFTAHPTDGIRPLSVIFTDTTTTTPLGDRSLTHLWHFGDGQTSTVSSPTHTYATRGAYTVTLTARNAVGEDTVTRTNYITVYEPVQAAFTASPTSGVAALTVVFTDTSTGDYTTSLWDFGDSVTGTLESPTHTYTAADVCTVTLMVSGPGGTDTLTRTNYITVYAPVRAAFTASPTSGVAPLTVVFTNTSTGDYTASLWDYGDGVTGTLQSPTHTYTAAGAYTVTLTVSGPGGTDALTRTNYITVYAPVRADFTASPTSGVAPLTVVFTNTSTGDYTASLWDFGDGLTSTLNIPTHTYTIKGVYPVTLNVMGPGGSDDEVKAGYIMVYEPVSAAFTASPTSGTRPLVVTFTNQSTGDYTASLWDFGDGVTSTLQSPTHTYSITGTFTVSLTVSGPGGSDVAVQEEYITVSSRRRVYLPLVLRSQQRAIGSRQPCPPYRSVSTRQRRLRFAPATPTRLLRWGF